MRHLVVGLGPMAVASCCCRTYRIRSITSAPWLLGPRDKFLTGLVGSELRDLRATNAVANQQMINELGISISGIDLRDLLGARPFEDKAFK